VFANFCVSATVEKRCWRHSVIWSLRPWVSLCIAITLQTPQGQTGVKKTSNMQFQGLLCSPPWPKSSYGLEERCKLRQRCPGQSPGRKCIWAYFEPSKCIWWQQFWVLFY